MKTFSVEILGDYKGGATSLPFKFEAEDEWAAIIHMGSLIPEVRQAFARFTPTGLKLRAV